jgi:hypothetical protein
MKFPRVGKLFQNALPYTVFKDRRLSDKLLFTYKALRDTKCGNVL